MSDPDPQRELPNRTGGGCCGCKSRQERRGHDPLEKYGMVADRTRKCTDVACLFLFFLALLAMISVSAIALKYGNVKRLSKSENRELTLEHEFQNYILLVLHFFLQFMGQTTLAGHVDMTLAWKTKLWWYILGS